MIPEEKRRVAYINEMIETGHAAELVAEGEAYHARQLATIAHEICARAEVRVVLIAGPSSSGKTSTSHRLCLELLSAGEAGCDGTGRVAADFADSRGFSQQRVQADDPAQAVPQRPDGRPHDSVSRFRKNSSGMVYNPRSSACFSHVRGVYYRIIFSTRLRGGADYAPVHRPEVSIQSDPR